MNWLQRIRKEYGYPTQAVMASRLNEIGCLNATGAGVTLNTLKNWENGKVSGTAIPFRKIAEALVPTDKSQAPLESLDALETRLREVYADVSQSAPQVEDRFLSDAIQAFPDESSVIRNLSASFKVSSKAEIVSRTLELMAKGDAGFSDLRQHYRDAIRLAFEETSQPDDIDNANGLVASLILAYVKPNDALKKGGRFQVKIATHDDLWVVQLVVDAQHLKPKIDHIRATQSCSVQNPVVVLSTPTQDKTRMGELKAVRDWVCAIHDERMLLLNHDGTPREVPELNQETSHEAFIAFCRALNAQISLQRDNGEAVIAYKDEDQAELDGLVEKLKHLLIVVKDDDQAVGLLSCELEDFKAWATSLLYLSQTTQEQYSQQLIVQYLSHLDTLEDSEHVDALRQTMLGLLQSDYDNGAAGIPGISREAMHNVARKSAELGGKALDIFTKLQQVAPGWFGQGASGMGA